jgi:fructose/tagatose bisphosphate aldolase
VPKLEKVCLFDYSYFTQNALISYHLILLILTLKAAKFMDETNIDALAVCIGNVHGKYPPSGPNLRLDLLKVEKFDLLKGIWLTFHLSHI